MFDIKSILFITFIMKINKITPQEQKFLQRTKHIDVAPKSLYFIGKLPETEVKAVAIVGSRKPTAYGREVAEKLSYELAQKGIVIVSGLALGIDAIAHRGALDAHGATIAVLANGLDTVYPSSHKELARRVIESDGALLSEYAPGMPPLPHQFLERNRLVSGLSDAVIVVEAAVRSGTLSTATHALGHGREVFAVPGNITSPMSAGCNALIRQGATPVTSTQDILNVIAPEITEQTSVILGDTPEEQTILNLLKSGLRDGEELLIKSKLNAQEFNQTLSMLELKGAIKALGSNKWRL